MGVFLLTASSGWLTRCTSDPLAPPAYASRTSLGVLYCTASKSFSSAGWHGGQGERREQHSVCVRVSDREGGTSDRLKYMSVWLLCSVANNPSTSWHCQGHCCLQRCSYAHAHLESGPHFLLEVLSLCRHGHDGHALSHHTARGTRRRQRVVFFLFLLLCVLVCLAPTPSFVSCFSCRLVRLMLLLRECGCCRFDSRRRHRNVEEHKRHQAGASDEHPLRHAQQHPLKHFSRSTHNLPRPFNLNRVNQRLGFTTISTRDNTSTLVASLTRGQASRCTAFALGVRRQHNPFTGDCLRRIYRSP